MNKFLKKWKWTIAAITTAKVVAYNAMVENTYQPLNIATPFHKVTISQPVEVREQFPKGLELNNSKNNIDLIHYNNKYFMAFRTSSDHFASNRSLIQILSSKNTEKWDLETTIKMNADIREPRFIEHNKKLHFYFFKGGTNVIQFKPDTAYHMEKTTEGWSKPEKFHEKGFVPWRFKEHNGEIYASLYFGQELYNISKSQKRSHCLLLKSSDMENWQEVMKIKEAGCEELEFEFDENDTLWGTIRFEGWGGALVKAEKPYNNPEITRTPEKYDSALLHKQDNELYLIARRSLDGNVDKIPDYMPNWWRFGHNLVRYSLTRKRTSMYHLNKEKKTIDHMFDLPETCGDTAYPAITPLEDNKYMLLNYSSKTDFPWILGQFLPTRIQKSIIEFK